MVYTCQAVFTHDFVDGTTLIEEALSRLKPPIQRMAYFVRRLFQFRAAEKVSRAQLKQLTRLTRWTKHVTWPDTSHVDTVDMAEAFHTVDTDDTVAHN